MFLLYLLCMDANMGFYVLFQKSVEPIRGALVLSTDCVTPAPVKLSNTGSIARASTFWQWENCWAYERRCILPELTRILEKKIIAYITRPHF